MRVKATVGGVPLPQPDHYFSGAPGVPSRRSTVELILPEGRLVVLTVDRGVFSGDRVDPGTRLLLAEGPPVAPASRVLVDLGCGYGPLAVALALRAAALGPGPGGSGDRAGAPAHVWAVDVNERARELCRENAEANGVGDAVSVVAPDGAPPDLVVDELWSNPPIRIGKPALHDLLTSWLDRLRPGSGRAHLVVQKHLGADSLARWLTDAGWPTERIAARAGYRLLTVRPRDQGSAPSSDDPGSAPGPSGRHGRGPEPSGGAGRDGTT